MSLLLDSERSLKSLLAESKHSIRLATNYFFTNVCYIYCINAEYLVEQDQCLSFLATELVIKMLRFTVIKKSSVLYVIYIHQ